MKQCPEHNVELVGSQTRYGIRYACPVNGCTVVAWDGQTSTAANFTTRQIRKKAHELFDDLWKSKKFKRTELYKELAEHLQIKIEDTHIGYFDYDQCVKTITFSEKLKGENDGGN